MTTTYPDGEAHIYPECFFALMFVLVLSTAALIAKPAAAQNFGTAVAVSGSEVIIGDGANPGFPGKVYVFSTDNNSEDWKEEARLSVSEDVDRLGSSVAATQDLLVAGAPGINSAFVFQRDETGGWQKTATLTGSEEGFGSTVATDGEFIVVSSRGDEFSKPTVTVYKSDADKWIVDARLAPEEILSGDQYGSAIAVRNGVVLVGAPGAVENAGAVYSFVRGTATDVQSESQNGLDSGQQQEAEPDSGTDWSLASTLSTPLAAAGTRFGEAVSFVDASAMRVAIGMPGFARRTGIVVVFRREENSNRWSIDEQLLPFSSVRAEAFGSSVAATEKELWVGAPGYGGRFGTGAIYTFRLTEDLPDDVATAIAGHFGRSGTDSQTTGLGRTTESSVFPVRGLKERSRLGASMAAAGDVVVVGAPGFDNRAGAGIGFRSIEKAGENLTGNRWVQGSPLISEIQAYASMTGEMIECKEDAAGDFPCDGVDMSSFLSLKDLGADRGIRLNDLWGWEDAASGREYAIVGLSNQASFVDVTDAFNPIYLGKLPMPTSANMSVWRDMKVYKDHVYIVADGAGDHGMQVFDLRQLRGLETPRVFEPTSHYRGIHSAHNVVINEDTGFAYAVGSSSGGETCGGGLHMIDIREPANPTFAGCFSDGTTGRRGTGYSHDAQCVTYAGPDASYTGREICIGANETALSIADVTEKDNPVSVAIASYPNAQYTHQGWLTDDHRYFYMNDELDESADLVAGTRTLIFDLADLDDPLLVGEHIANTTETDHNLYVKGDLMYQSNTGAGLRILDISDPEHPFETAFFDTSPVGGRGGTWSNYPYFKSGKIAVTGGHYGLFILRKKTVEF